ncbi:MAG TPA: nucleotidyltransferase domain-containing protein [Gaiellaceae bacterium]|nr:nucleotidyltransferase domain-containing protein [Gaiellaceae bacterium]
MDFRHPLGVVTPTLDGDVLAVLARADVELSGREVQRALGRGSHTGVRRCLTRLVHEGIVLERPAGNALLYRLNRDHLAAPQIEALAVLRLRLFEQLRAAIRAWDVPPALAAVFGSVARGDADAGSDLDILVIRPAGVDDDDEVWRDQVMALERSASSWTGNDCRALEYAQTELPRLRVEEPVIAEIAADGIALAGNLRDLVSSG